MRLKAMKFFACFAVVLMLVSVLPAGALAAEDNDGKMTPRGASLSSDDAEQNMTHDQIRDRFNATDDAPRNEVATQTRGVIQSDVAQSRFAKERIETVRNDYSDAKKDFQDMKIKINNKKVSADSSKVAEVTRAYINHTVEYMITHLETVKKNAENAGGDSTAEISETIDGYVEQLQQQQANVESAQTRQEFADAAKEIRKIWNDAQKRAKYFAGQSVNERLNNFLAKSEGLSPRLESEINRLKAEGEDTEKLEEMLAEYNELIGEAKQNQEQTRNTFQNRNGQNDDAVNEANQYMHQATKNIQEANGVLKDMFDELKSHRRGGSISLDGTEKLATEGNGTAVFSGNLTIDINATNAKLVVKDLAGDAEIIIDGEYTEVNDNDEEDNNNRALVYHDFTGTAHITGSRLTIMVHGDDLNITAEGKGSSILSGRGSYNVEKAGMSSEEMRWAGDDDDSTDSGSDDTPDGNKTDENETEGNDIVNGS